MTLHLTEREATRLFFEGTPMPRKRPTKRDTSSEDLFAFQCRAMKLPAVERAYKLDKSQFPGNLRRRWSFDFAFQQHWLFVEIDGGIWIRGAHAHPTDILRNMRKRNDAALLGFSVLAFTPAEVKSGYAVGYTERVLAERGWMRL